MSHDVPFALGAIAGDDAQEEEAGVALPVEDLIPTCVRTGADPKALNRPLDPSIYGYDITKMSERPWSKPGVDKSDYFNYGFDEESWRAYCALQARGHASLRARADELISQLGAPMAAAYPTHAPQQSIPSTTSHGAMYKTRLCQQFMHGQCSKGNTCSYAHGEEELRRPPERSYMPQPPAPLPLPPRDSVLGAPMPAMPSAPMQSGPPRATGFRMAPQSKRDRSPGGENFH